MAAFTSTLRGGLIAAAALATLTLAACSDYDGVLPKHMRPLDQGTRDLVERKGMDERSPILIRLFKEEAALEVWKQQRATGKYALLKEYEICAWSGVLGPKKKEGDRQAPEGFYTIRPAQMNPNSSYYLAFNMGYPNEYDRSLGRTGAELMVHGACSSRGCYSMTDESIQEIYTLGRLAFQGGQRDFQVQAFPFRMTPENMARHRNDPNMPFWRMLKEGYDHFEVVRQPPKVDVCNRRYVFNSVPADGRPFVASAACPAMTMPEPIRIAVAEREARDDAEMLEIAARLDRRQDTNGASALTLALAEPTSARIAAPMSVASGAVNVEPSTTASVGASEAPATPAPGAAPVSDPAPIDVANAPASSASVPEPAPAVSEPAQDAAPTESGNVLPLPDLRPSQDAAPPPPAATEQPQPEPESPAENATLEERMLVESAPTDPDVANAYANAEEGGLTGLLLRLYQQPE